jgi:hypothetical protein
VFAGNAKRYGNRYLVEVKSLKAWIENLPDAVTSPRPNQRRATDAA